MITFLIIYFTCGFIAGFYLMFDDIRSCFYREDYVSIFFLGGLLPLLLSLFSPIIIILAKIKFIRYLIDR